MITKKNFEAKTLTPKSLLDILMRESNVKRVSVIEDVLQRPLVWDTANIETLWGDIFKCIQCNIQGNISHSLFGGNVYDKGYLNIGSLEYSELEEYNVIKLQEKYGDTFDDLKSIVDGSQRGRINVLLALAFIYKISEVNNEMYISLDSFKMENGCYKIIEAGREELSRLYEYIETTPLSEIGKELSNNKYSIEKLEKRLSNEDEKKYFDIFALFLRLIERDIYGTYNLMDSFCIFMTNVSFYEEYIDKEHKFERFVDRNKKGTPMSDESMYPKYIINKFENKEKLLNCFNKFKEKAQECESNNRFAKTKKGLNSILYIMIEVLKIKLGFEHCFNNSINTNCIFSSTFDLKDINYGIEKCFSDKIFFRNENEAIDYFNECYNVAEFLNDISFKNNEKYIDNYFYFRNTAEKDCLWWYLIKPLYLSHSLYKIEKYETYSFLMKYFFRVYTFYSILRVQNTNSQNFINLMEEISINLIKYQNDEVTLKTKLIVDLENYAKNYGGIKKVINDGVSHLSYTTPRHKNAIKTVFRTIEYSICEECGFDSINLINLWLNKGKKYNLDHWKPKNIFSKDEEEYDDEYDKIGNLVLLEESLNKSKGDNEIANSKTYCQSKLYQTSLFEIGNRGSFYNKELEKFNETEILCRFEVEEINSPSLESIRKRTNFIKMFLRNFISKFIENNK